MSDEVTERTTEPTQPMEGHASAENGERSASPAELLRRVHEAQGQLTTSPYSHDALELSMATTISAVESMTNDTALVWLMLVGVPSADKTETVRALKDLRNILYVDSLTENAFASGYVPPQGAEKKPDLLTIMEQEQRTCLIVKDMTTLFSMRDEKVKQLLGDLQSIYDGEYAKATGTKGLLRHQVKFSLLACITSAALDKHHRYMSQIGSRFLFYRMNSRKQARMGMGWIGIPGTATGIRSPLGLLWPA